MGGLVMEENFLVPIPGNIFMQQEDSSVSNPAKMHYHDFYEIYYLISGNRDYIINGEIFNISPDTIVLVSPNSLHKTQGGDYKRILIQFTDNYLNNFFNKSTKEKLLSCFNKNYLKIPPNNKRDISVLFFKLLSYYENKDTDLLFPPLSELLQYLNRFCQEDDNNKITPKYTDKRLTEILKFINQNFTDITSISQIADAFFLNKYYLCHFFKNNTGISLINYINKLKVSHALGLIKNTDMSITNIAMSCGFNATNYFCNTFKKLIGVAPSEYRAMYKNK
jgi:AraC-like DNA-binding protein